MVSHKVVAWDQVYDGSRSFQFLAEATKMPLDQVNFLLAQLAAVALSLLLRTKLPPLSYSASRYKEKMDEGLSPEEEHQRQRRHRARHQFALASGIALTYFCFGKQVLFALVLGLVCYSLLLLLPAYSIHRVTLFVCMTLLSVAHLYRQTLQQATFVIDITGPLMLMVQRATTVAFGLHDGRAKASSSQTKLQQRNALTAPPSLLEYFSYLLSFHSIMAGPFLMFRDYQDYITGSDEFARAVVLQKSVEQAKQHRDQLSNGSVDNNEKVNSAASTTVNNNNNDVHGVPAEPLNPTGVAARKLALGGLYAFSTVLICPMLPVSALADPSFSTYSFPYKLLMVIVTTTLARHLYYTAWLLAEGTCNIGGLGYSGTDAHGHHTWNGASNVDIMGVEFSSSFRNTLDSWNRKTMIWLRYAAYERLPPKYQVGGTYLLSSTWHGYYPGYYCTFFAGALLTVAARTTRRSIRPLVVAAQGGETGSIMNVYHVVTWLAARLMLSYSTFSFVLLNWAPTLFVYWELFFYLHLLGLFVMAVLPQVLPPPRRSATSSAAKPQKPVQNGTAAERDEVCHSYSNGTVLNGALKTGFVRQRLQGEQAQMSPEGGEVLQAGCSVPSQMNADFVQKIVNAVREL